MGRYTSNIHCIGVIKKTYLSLNKKEINFLFKGQFNIC